ncbi:MAG: arylsulfatase A-like enzyme [Rhodothermales bacterium]|jgi:arylsulfatase A-like enzyme
MTKGLLTLGAFLCCMLSLHAADKTRPNIILFLVDDMGWQDTSVPFHTERTPYNDHFRTPHMERLAAQGMKFTQAYAASVCSPSRCAIMTGKNPTRHGVTNWTLYKDRDQSGKTKRLQAPRDWTVNGLTPDDVTLPKLLQGQGYRTIHCGKAHFGAKDTPGESPANVGFHVNIAGHAAGGPGSFLGTQNFSAAFRKGGRVWDVPGLEKYHGKDIFLTEALTIEAKSEVASAVKSGTPFYLYMAHYAVHVPFAPDKRFYQEYRDAGVDHKEAMYAAMVEGMDKSLGDLLAHVEALGVAEDTIVVFASDNGGLSVSGRGRTVRGTGANTHCWPLKAGKGSAYEGGTRIPMIVAWAKTDAANALQQRIPIALASTCEQPVICEDFMPTFCAWAGVDDLPSKAPDIDGVDITGYIVGDASFSRTGPLLFHYPHMWGPRGLGYEPHSSIRVGDWKAIYFYEGQRWELYNLAQDIGEKKELAAAHPERLNALASRMKSEHQRLGAKYPSRRDNSEPDLPIWP